jgi:hypothetical protein
VCWVPVTLMLVAAVLQCDSTTTCNGTALALTYDTVSISSCAAIAVGLHADCWFKVCCMIHLLYARQLVTTLLIMHMLVLLAVSSNCNTLAAGGSETQYSH